MKKEIVCSYCGARIVEKPHRSFLLGFQTYTCAACHKETTLPLTTGTRVMYWCLIAAGLLGLLVAFEDGGFATFPWIGIFVFVVSVFALIKDRGLRKKIKMAI